MYRLDFDFFKGILIGFRALKKYAGFIGIFSKALFLLVFLVFLF